MATIGFENAHYAVLTKDNATGATYGTPKRLPGAINISETMENNTTELYADNRLWATATVFSKGTLELELADLSTEDAAALLGHMVENGKIKYNANDVAPYICLMGEFMKDDGVTKRYFKLLKGQCAESSMEAKTKSDSPEFTTVSLTATFMPRQFDGDYKYIIDSDSDNAATVIANWYTSV